MAQNMGLGVLNSACFQRKFRWVMQIEGVSGADATLLLPIKSARPSLSFKEIEVIHLNENIFFPSRPDWKPIPLTLIDIVKNNNPIIEWIKTIYDAGQQDAGGFDQQWNPSLNGPFGDLKRDATLLMLDGCGNIIEQWKYDNAYPNNIEWGDLDMAESGIVTVDITLRYDRAYVV